MGEGGGGSPAPEQNPEKILQTDHMTKYCRKSQFADWKEEYIKYIYRMICELLAEVYILLRRITAAVHK